MSRDLFAHVLYLTPRIPADTVLPYNMKVAAYNGLLSSNLGTLPNPPFSCSTGNCTWEPFSTLAISSQCINITDQVSLNCTKDTPDCNLIAPNDPTLQSLLNGSTYNDAFYIEAGPGIRHLPVLESYANMTGFLSLVQWVKARGIGNSGGALNSGIHPTTPFEAGRCFFYFSVIEVQVQVTNGVYSQNILQEYTQVQNRPSAPTSILNGTEFFFIDPWDYPMSETLVYQPAFAKKPPNSNDTFNVPFETFAQLGSLLWSSDFLNGNVSVGFSSGAQGNSENVLLLYEADNIPRAMENLAQYMTTEIRVDDTEILQEEQGNVTFVAAQQAVVGTVWTQQQIVTVEWAWLALPTALLILSIILFTATCLKSNRTDGVGLWASSPLTLFFQGQLSRDLTSLRCSKRELNTAEKMEDAAAGLWAQITTTSLDGTIGVHQKVDHRE